jgi:copper(I)-binding protein
MRRLLSTVILAALAATQPAVPSRAQNAPAGPITVSGAWVRASLGHAPNASSYLTIENTGGPDKLIGAKSPAARKLELHSHTLDGHTARMRPVTNIPVPAGGTVKLDPNGFHIMFLALKAPLREGDKVVITLQFEKAGALEIEVEVRSAPSQMPAAPQGDAPDSTAAPAPPAAPSLPVTAEPAPPVPHAHPAPPPTPAHTHPAPSN